MVIGCRKAILSSLSNARSPYDPILAQTTNAVRGFVVDRFFGLSAVGAFEYPSATFYLAPPRAWELLLGVLLAIQPWTGGGHGAIRNLVALLGLAMIVFSIMAYSVDTPFPGATALVPCVGAACIISAGQAGFSSSTYPLAPPGGLCGPDLIFTVSVALARPLFPTLGRRIPYQRLAAVNSCLQFRSRYPILAVRREASKARIQDGPRLEGSSSRSAWPWRGSGVGRVYYHDAWISRPVLARSKEICSISGVQADSLS